MNQACYKHWMVGQLPKSKTYLEIIEVAYKLQKTSIQKVWWLLESTKTQSVAATGEQKQHPKSLGPAGEQIMLGECNDCQGARMVIL